MGKTDDHSSFVSYYEEHKNALLTYLMYRLNFNRPLAEDLFMDIVLKAYEHYEKFDTKKGSFKSWVFTIAHHHLINYWRDHKPMASLEALEEEGVSIASNPPENSADQASEHHQILKVLSFLSEEDRGVIAMRFLDHLDYDEIASALHKKEGAVRTQLSRALQHFKHYFDKIYPQTS